MFPQQTPNLLLIDSKVAVVVVMFKCWVGLKDLDYGHALICAL